MFSIEPHRSVSQNSFSARCSPSETQIRAHYGGRKRMDIFAARNNHTHLTFVEKIEIGCKEKGAPPRLFAIDFVHKVYRASNATKPAAVRCGVGKPAAGMLYSLQRAVRALGNESRFTQHFLLRASVSTVTAKFSMPMCEIVRTLLCCQLFLRLYQIPQNHI